MEHDSARLRILGMFVSLIAASALVAAQDSSVYATLVETAGRLLQNGEPVRACEVYRQAVEKMQGAGAPSELVVSVLIGLSTALLDSGEISQAERTLIEAGELANKNDMLAAAELANNWAGVHARLGRHSEARAELMAAIYKVGNAPAAQKFVPSILDNLATAEIHLGQYSEALQHQRRAVEMWTKFLPADHPNLLKGYTVLATAQYMVGNFEASRSTLEVAIPMAERIFGRQSQAVARLMQGEVIVLSRMGLKKEWKARKRELSRMPPPKIPNPGIYTLAATNTSIGR